MISSGSLENAEPSTGAGMPMGRLKSSLEYKTPLTFIFRSGLQWWSVPISSRTKRRLQDGASQLLEAQEQSAAP